MKNIFPGLSSAEKALTTKILSYSFDAQSIDMNMIRKTNFQRIKGDKIAEYCYKVVTTTQFNFEPIAIYYTRGKRMLAEGRLENISPLILNTNIWLDLFIRYNMETLINVINKYAIQTSITDKKSITKNIYKTILEHIHLITIICKYLCPYLESPNDISDVDILRVVVNYFVMNIDCVFVPYIYNSEIINNEVDSESETELSNDNDESYYEL